MSYDQPIRETMSKDRVTVTKETTKDGKKSISKQESRAGIHVESK